MLHYCNVDKMREHEVCMLFLEAIIDSSSKPVADVKTDANRSKFHNHYTGTEAEVKSNKVKQGTLEQENSVTNLRNALKY